MKRAGIFLTIIFFIAILATSCASSNTIGCPAYGNNVHQYQKEVKY
ncbi:MAG: hypothetical protein JXR71_01720 [Bacteroidales bacterium]|nr:hypothetical protein [Bacteroidales bacterium]